MQSPGRVALADYFSVNSNTEYPTSWGTFPIENKKVFVLVQKSYVYAQDYPLEEEAQIVKISPSLIKLCVSITHHHFLVIVSTTQAPMDTAKVVDLISCTKFT